ncbi:hypothetical protein D3C87_1692540 [compost metagenome]
MPDIIQLLTEKEPDLYQGFLVLQLKSNLSIIRLWPYKGLYLEFRLHKVQAFQVQVLQYKSVVVIVLRVAMPHSML